MDKGNEVLAKSILNYPSLKSREFCPTLWALHLQTHPLDEATTVILVLTWCFHNPVANFYVLWVGFRILGQRF